MSGLRFKVGEPAILMDVDHPERSGSWVTVDEVGPFKVGHVFKDGCEAVHDCDYSLLVVDLPDGWTCQDFELRKIDPPAEPASLTRENEVVA